MPANDAQTYELIRSGQTLGVFQIESPGQWHLLAKAQPGQFDDLVAQVALFRPGPLQVNMVHPYVARRRDVARVHYPHPCLEPVLRDTYGVILFQEQVLEVAHRFAGMNLKAADEFRRLMSRERDRNAMEAMRQAFVEGALRTHANTSHPVGPGMANRVFDLVAKFVGYGFCRSHAAAFARTVYQSAYLKAPISKRTFPLHIWRACWNTSPAFIHCKGCWRKRAVWACRYCPRVCCGRASSTCWSATRRAATPLRAFHANP